MAITQVINPMSNTPSISDPANFEAKAEAFLVTDMVTRANELNNYAGQANLTAAEMNVLAAAMSLNSTNDTSVTSNSISIAVKTFTVSASKSYVKGMYVVAADTAAPSTNSMYGIVDSYSGTTLVVNVLSIRGTGTKTAWTISQSAAGVTAETYTRSNILGTVSQSGGVPTGAVAERGSNANGSYVKYFDGRLECTQTIANISSNNSHPIGFVSIEIVWVFPASFIATPSVSAYAGNSSLVMGFASPTTTQVSFKTWVAASGVSTSPNFTAIGRWF